MSEIPDNEIDEIDETRNLQKNIRMSESKVGKTQFVKITKGPTRKSLISFVQSEAFDDFSERVDFMVSFTSLPKQGPRQSDNIDVIVKHLDKLCLKPERDRHQLHLNRIRALKLIKQFIRTGQGDTVLENPACHLIWAMFLCMHHFHVRLKTTSGLISYLRRKEFKKSTNVYEDLLTFIPKAHHNVIINGTILFLREGKIWRCEYLCCEILIPLIVKTNNLDDIILQLLFICEITSVENVLEAHHCMSVILLVLDNLEFSDISFELISVILHMYRSSIEPLDTDEFNYVPLKYGLLYCLIKLFPFLKISNRIKAIYITCDMLYDIVSNKVVIELADMAAKVEMYGSVWNDFTSGSEILDIQNLSLSHWYDTNINIIRFLARIGINSADVLGNKKKFETPRLFLKDEHYGLNIKKISTSQKQYAGFLVNLRLSLLACLKNFMDCREVLERVYCIICIYCCQLPSGSTAASVCCLAMGIQNHALADKDKMSFEHQSYLHAMAISLLSLVCHIHKADHFYNYVNKVIYNRAKMANHMLPPLKVACEYPRHLVLSNSSEFLLDKWEIRYGLWKSFRIKGKKYENEFAKFAFNTLQ